MTQKVKMRSLSSHRYGADELKKGDPFEADVRHVELLKALGRAKLEGEEGEPAKPQTRPAPPRGSANNSSRPQQNSRRQYNRRDMKAKR